MARPTFEAVDDHINLAGRQLLLELGCPQVLALETVERRDLVTVPERSHRVDDKGLVWEALLQSVPDALGLNLCQDGLAGANTHGRERCRRVCHCI